MSISYQRMRKQDLLLMAVQYEKLNKEELIGFLMQQKGDDFNILDAWGYAELEAAIKEFANQKTVIVQIEQPEGKEIVVQTKTNTGLIINDEQHYREIIKCKQIPGNQIVGFLKQNPELILQPDIPQFEIIDEGMFTPNYVNYKIVIEALDSSVWRRVEYFYWLSDMLNLQYPDSLVPPLPAKTLLRKFTPEHLSKRCKMLKQFLCSILSNHLLRQSEFVEGFLLMDDDVKFKQLMVASQVLKPAPRLQELSNMDGQLIAEFNPVLNQYFMEMNNYLLHTNDTYKDMTDDSRFLVNSLKDFRERVKKMAGDVKRLKEQTKDFNSKSIIGNICILEFIYTILEEYLTEWCASLERLSHALTENFYEFFRFQRDMQQKCVDLISCRNKAQSKYVKEQQDLLKKKIKYFQSEPMEKWELAAEVDRVKVQTSRELAIPLMFPKETAEVEEQKMKFAYANRQAYEQINQYFDSKSVLYATRLQAMSLRKKEHTEEHYKTLEQTAKQIDAMLEMRKGVREGLELRQEWIDHYFYPLSVTTLLK